MYRSLPNDFLFTRLAQESIEIKNQLHKNLFIAHHIKEMHKIKIKRIEILFACIGSSSFPANHLFIQGCNQKSAKNIMKKQERHRNIIKT